METMAEKTYPKEFEEYYKAHYNSLKEAAPLVLKEELKSNVKMNTTGDWLLFIVPFVVGFGFMNTHVIKAEIPNFIVALVIMVVCYGLTMLIRPYVTGKRSITDVEADIKAYFFTVYQKGGIKELERIRA